MYETRKLKKGSFKELVSVFLKEKTGLKPV